LECVFALKKNWPVIFAVALDVTLISILYGIKKDLHTVWHLAAQVAPMPINIPKI